MITLRTASNFTVVRQIANHLDTDTNYVRAVIRNAYTDAIIETLDLEDKGSQRFKKNWKVPADPSGQGFYISIVTSVYTDDGYTTKNQNYGDEESTYLVADRERVGRGGGVDAYTVRRIMKEEIDNIPKPEKVVIPEFPEIPEVKFDKVLTAINSLKVALKPEKPEKVDFKPLFDALQAILSAINEKEVTKPTDLSPILEKFEEKDESDRFNHQEVVILLNQLEDKLTAELPEKISTMLSDTTFSIAPSTASAKAPKVEKEEPKPYDLSKLSI